MKTLAIFSFFIFSNILFFVSALHAADEYNVTSGITSAGTPLGVHGVDTYTLKNTGTASAGSAVYTAEHDGVSYYFSSANSKRKFERKPDAYLPEFGGYCALAIGLGKKFDGDPQYADVYKGKLYVFVNKAVFEKYLANKDRTLAKSEKKWADIKHTPVAEL